MSASRDRQSAIDTGRYHGADHRAESGQAWQDSAEIQLRRHCRSQSAEIQRLEKENRRLSRENAELRKQALLKDTLPMLKRATR